jgi:hypothetical protein
MDMKVWRKDDSDIPVMWQSRAKSTEFYNRLAATFRGDDTAVVRIDPEGRHHVAIRQAMRIRGIYVKVSAKSGDRPYVTIALDEGHAIDPKPFPTELPPQIVLSEKEGAAFLAVHGKAPDEGYSYVQGLPPGYPGTRP